MAHFKQTESITRKLAVTLLLISVFFLIEVVGLYFSSQTLLRGLSDLYRVNQSNSFLENGKKVMSSIEDTLKRQQDHLQAKDTAAIFTVANQQEHELLTQALETTDPRYQYSLGWIHDAQKNLDDLTLLLFEDGQVRHLSTAQVFIGLQYGLEFRENLNKAQLELSSQADRIFSEVYANRFRPIAVSLSLAVVLLLVTLLLGRRIARHISRSLQNLRQATTAVAAGKLDFRVPILAPDEFGYLTDEFNRMTENLNASTVSRNFVESIIESMLDGVLVLSSSGEILRANKVMSKTFGYDMIELVGKSLQQLISISIADMKNSNVFEAEGTSQTGHHFPVSVSISPLESEKGLSGRLVCVIRDITDLKEAEKELKARNLALANTNRELETFSYSVSHDLRSPLRSVDGFSLALLEDFGDRLDERAKNYLIRIRAAVQKMGTLIDDLLNLSRITRSSLHPIPVNLSQIAQDVMHELHIEEPQRDVEAVIQDEVRTEADPNLIRVVMQNLLGNAWKYTSKHPHARIEFGALSNGVTPEGEKKPVFYVRDDGAGFDMAYSKNLFGAFQRLHTDSEFPGTGVGLATVQRVIHRHGGTIWAEAAVEKGTTFYFTL
jgi:PAS domain S-box-containing protein